MKKILNDYKSYLIQLIPIVLAGVAGVIFFLYAPYGYIISSSMFIFSMIYSVYILKKFDLRPDVTKAREDIKSMEEKYKKYIKEIEELRMQYSDMKSKIDEAKTTLFHLKNNLDRVAHGLNGLSSKLHNVEVIAKITALTTGIKAVKDLIDNS